MRTVLRPNIEGIVVALPQVDAGTHVVAERIVRGAQVRAPKDTGAGAASIHAERRRSGHGWVVGWDPEHDYMRFHEFGTEDMPARPFLRPAAAAVSNSTT